MGRAHAPPSPRSICRPWPSAGSRNERFSCTALGLPGRLTISVLARMAAAARVSMARGGVLQAVGNHGRGNAGDHPLGDIAGRFWGAVPGGKAGAAGGQQQVAPAAVAQLPHGGGKPVPFIGQQDGAGDEHPGLLAHLRNQRAAFIHPFAPAALIAGGQHSDTVGQGNAGGQQRQLIPD